jgi:diguanylate cyclase (GGDEF)-like protein
LERRSRREVQLLSLVAVCAIAMIDTLTSREFSLAILYLAPILATTWVGGRRVGLVMAVASALISVGTELLNGLQRASVISHLWAGLVRTGFFVIAVSLLAALKQALARERALARSDALTGLPNRTAFFERADAELARRERYGRPLTLAFVDCDHFKAINDARGHQTGDQVLTSVAVALHRAVRGTDLAARIGGDEFAILFPELGTMEARVVIAKLQTALALAMQAGGWPMTFSIGVVTCLASPSNFDELVAKADSLMYEVKSAGRNAARFSVVGAHAPAPMP